MFRFQLSGEGLFCKGLLIYNFDLPADIESQFNTLYNALFCLKAISMSASSLPSRRLSVAPMLDWTDRHYRFMARQITRNAWLYSEMVNSGAVVYGDKDRFFEFQRRRATGSFTAWRLRSA